MRSHRPTLARRPRAHGGSAAALPVVVAPQRCDPFWTRLGFMVMTGLLLAPLVVALGREDRTLQGQASGGAVAIVQPVARASSTLAMPLATPADVVDVPQAVGGADAPASPTGKGSEAPAQVTQPPAPATACTQTYRVHAGDYWFGIADRAGVSVYELAAVNGATLESALHPGEVLCLPAGSVHPVPPPTAPARASTRPASPGSTAAPTTAPRPAPAPLTARPVTTTSAPPTSTSRAPKSYSAEEVEAIIRSVFPDAHEEQAIAVARRESGLRPWVHNGTCCYGLFQIYWNVHRGWLDDLGIGTSRDLLDPWLNTRAAYALFQRSGNSWSPWGG